MSTIQPLYVGVMGAFEDAEFTIAVHSDGESANAAKGERSDLGNCGSFEGCGERSVCN